MADFNDVVNQLKENNEAEKARDSNLNRNVANLRESNKEAFSQFIVGQEQNKRVVQEMVDADATNKSADVEQSKEDNFQTEKQTSLLEKLGAGLSSIASSMKSSFTALTGGSGSFGKFIRGTLLAGLFLAIANFLSSPLFGELVDYLTNTIMPALDNFFENSIKPFGRAIAKLFKGDFAGALTEILDIDNPLGLAAGIAGVALLLKPKAMLSGLKAGVGLLSSAFSKLGTAVGGTKLPGGAPKGGLPGVPTKAQGITKTAKSFAEKGKSAGQGVGKFISGILKGIASGLTAIANPAAIGGLALVSAAILAIATAIRIASPAFEPIGKLVESFGESIESVFTGIGTFVESTGKSIRSVVEGIGTAIGNVVDKLSKMSTAGTDATTKQIKELSKIPSDKLLSAAKGIDAMKKALDDFGGGTFSKISDSLFGGGGPIEKIVELAKNVNPLLKAAEAISVISAAGGDYAMAQSELKRRERVAELEKELAEDTKGITQSQKSFDKEQEGRKAELAALKKQKMELKLSGSRARGGPMNADEMYLVGETGPELVMPKSASMVQSEQKTDAILKSALDKSSNGQQAINVVAPQAKVTNNSANTNVSNTSYVGNPDMAFQLAAGT